MSLPRLCGLRVLVLLAIGPCLFASSATGQEDAATAAEAEVEEPPDSIEAIRVIGEHLDATDVQDEAQAITAFSADDLDRANIFNVDALAYSVPGLHVGQQGTNAIITLRGVGTENASLTGEPGVAFHVDGVNYGRPSAARVAFFDLETLEVKRGPQGLIGGKNSTSGHINLVTKKPHDEYEVDLDVLFGNYDRVRIRSAVNLPLGEFGAARLATYHEDRDGYLDNINLSSSRDPFDADDFGLRGHLRLSPADSLDLLVSYNYFKHTGNGAQSDIVPFAPRSPDCPTINLNSTTVMPRGAACYRTPSEQELRFVGGIPTIVEVGLRPNPASEDDDPRKIAVDRPSGQDNRYWGFSSDLDWSVPVLPILGETRVKLIGGWQKTETNFGQDFDATDRAIFEFDAYNWAQQNSTEVQWSGTLFGERLDWQAGYFWSWERAEQNIDTPGLGGQSGVFSDQTTENKSYGYMLHTTFRITPTVRLQLGGRLVKDEKSTQLLRDAPADTDSRFRGCTGDLGIGEPGSGAGGLGIGPSRENVPCEGTWRGNPWGVGVDWRPFGGDHLLYLKIDRGYKSGGFRAGTVGGYLPEKIWAYAAGVKSEFFDRRLQLNIEGFFYAYQDMQLVVLDGLSLRTENADARMRGIDLEAIGRPLSGLTLSAVVSYLKTETRDYFSLDPADSESNFDKRRLQSRDVADNQAAEGLPDARPYAEQENCATPENFSIETRCGNVTEFGGFDDFSDNQLSRSPEWKITLWSEYEIPLGRLGTLTPRIQYTWQDDTYFRAFNRDFDLQEAYHLTDVKLTWRSPEETWLVEAFVQNIEDEAPKTNVLVGPREFDSPPYAWYGPPRYYGVMVAYQF